MKHELTQLLAQLVAFYPITSEQENVKKVLDFCAEQFALDGTQIITNDGVFTLTASTSQSKKPKVLLAAHVDVVPSDKVMRTSRVEESRLIGRGTKDMLFAVASYIWLIHELRDQLSALDIAILLNGDEEVGGGSSIPHFLELGWRPTTVWLPDAGNNLQELVVREKGVYNIGVSFKGKAHHGSRPWEGDNAATKLIHFLSEIETLFGVPSSERSTCSITGLQAGEAANQGPAHASCRLDIRYTDNESLSQIKLWLNDACRRFNAEITDIMHAPAHIVDTQSHSIQTYLAINQTVTNRGIEFIDANGSSDARYFGEQGIPVILASPLGGGIHSDEEWISLDSLVEYCIVMKEYVLKTARI